MASEHEKIGIERVDTTINERAEMWNAAGRNSIATLMFLRRTGVVEALDTVEESIHRDSLTAEEIDELRDQLECCRDFTEEILAALADETEPWGSTD